MQKRGSSLCSRESQCSSQVETGMSENFLSCNKGVKDPFKVQEGRCDLPQDASAEKDLISPGGENPWIFLSCGRSISSQDEDLRNPLLWPQERPVSMRVARGLLRFLSSRCCGLTSCVESRPETEDTFSVLTWIFGYFWSLLWRVSPRLEWAHAHWLSSRAVAEVSSFPSR